MPHELFIRRALRRREVFKTLKETVHKIDPEAEVFLFGSVAKGKYNYSSDIDVLIITKFPAAKIHLELWRAGIKEPFEIHVQPPEKARFYRKRAKLLKI